MTITQSHELKKIIQEGYQAELIENDELARDLETQAYRFAIKLFGEDWWSQHETECVSQHANAVECWENLAKKVDNEDISRT